VARAYGAYPVIVAGMIAAMLLWPLLPYALGAAGQSLWAGLSGAPHELWGRLGDWISLGFRAALANGLFFLLWSLMGRPVAVALAVYPLLATALVAGATALYTRAPEEVIPDPPASPALLLTFPLLAGGALAGWSLLNNWAGWYPSPLTAIAAQDYQPGQYAAADAYRIRYSVQEANTQLVIWQGGPRSYMGLTRLEQGRFGWKILRHDPSFPLMDPHAPADIRFTRLDDGAVYWGEIFDDRVAYLQALGARFPIGQEGPLFILPVTPPTLQYYGENVQLLDRNGNPVQPKGD
jgi:hypothetical protein